MRLTIVFLMFVGGIAEAQTLAQKAEADSLFDEGKKDMQAGKLAEACAAFEGSYKLVQRLGTELNLADCYAKIGRTASAWAAFREAQGIAAKSGDDQRAGFAQQQAATIEPKLNRIVITADPSAKNIVRDGQPVDAVELGRAVPVDAGKHTVSADFARGSFTKTVDVSGEGQTITVEIKPEAAIASAPKHTEPGRSSWTSARIAGVGVGAGGLVLLGVSGALTLVASSTWSDGKADCPNNVCNDKGLAAYDKAGRLADAATITVIAGGACLAAGTILYLLGKPRAETTVAPTALRGGAGLFVTGRF